MKMNTDSARSAFRMNLIALVLTAINWLPMEAFVNAMAKASTARPSIDGQEPTLANLAGIEAKECSRLQENFEATRKILMDTSLPEFLRLQFIDAHKGHVTMSGWLTFVYSIKPELAPSDLQGTKHVKPYGKIDLTPKQQRELQDS